MSTRRSMEPLMDTSDVAAHYTRVASGKVRDIYALDADTLLFCTTDRISAYDVILENGIPEKGAILTLMSAHWFIVLSEQIPELRIHMLTLKLPPPLKTPELAPRYRDRTMQVRKLKVLPVESIVRGYITGSAWSSYVKTGLVNGLQMPQGLQESEKLFQPMWTPSTKAEQGEHDENISPEKAAELIGADNAKKMEALSLQLYSKARDYAGERGIIIADTKFEFGLDLSGEIVLIDEVLTPDSSRFWDAEKYQIGKPQDSLDKQYLRDWLTSTGQKGKDGVSMTPEVVARTKKGYQEAYERLVGMPWELARGA